MRKIFLLYSVLLLISACKKQTTELQKQNSVADNQSPTLSKAEINNYISQSVQIKKDFKWDYVNDKVVWSALLQTDDKVLSIGYKPATWRNADVSEKMGTFDIHAKEWEDAKEAVLKIVFEEERKKHPDLKIEHLEAWPEKYLPVVCVSVDNIGLIKKLRESDYVRYVEPIGYDYEFAPIEYNQKLDNSKFFGCDGAPAYPGLLSAGVNYTIFPPSTKVSWHYNFHNITQAWKVSSGKGIKVMVIDTGCSLDQENLNSQFNQGQSENRTIEQLVTLPRKSFLGIPYGDEETPRDMCGHGTLMAGIVGAPRGTDGNACGVAYNANLVTVRAAKDVILNESREVKGVADAFNLAASRDDIKIISMSMGYPFFISQIADAVRNAANKGKLIFCAAGTTSRLASWLWVAFPASMPEVNAVTGIQDNIKSRCTNCHDGKEVDFVVVMQKSNNKNEVLSLAARGDKPATVGGSSAATASMAGMAALVWSINPNKSSNQILNILKNSARNPGNSNWGFGLVDAAKAVGANPVLPRIQF